MISPEKPVRVLIADSQFLITESLKLILNEGGSFISDTVITGKDEIFKALSETDVSVLIIDPSLIDLNSISEIRDIKLRFPDLIVVVLTNSLSKTELHELNSLGIINILLKTADKEEIFEALQAAIRGKKYYSSEFLDILFEEAEKRSLGDEVTLLTPSEMEIVRLIAEGLTTKEIASRKYISFHTVISHRKNIFRKLGVSSVSELLMLAIKSGWINMIEYHI
jgi:DNA-binding NarL/FixJ family response regulator